MLNLRGQPLLIWGIRGNWEKYFRSPFPGKNLKVHSPGKNIKDPSVQEKKNRKAFKTFRSFSPEKNLKDPSVLGKKLERPSQGKHFWRDHGEKLTMEKWIKIIEQDLWVVSNINGQSLTWCKLCIDYLRFPLMAATCKAVQPSSCLWFTSMPNFTSLKDNGRTESHTELSYKIQQRYSVQNKHSWALSCKNRF